MLIQTTGATTANSTSMSVTDDTVCVIGLDAVAITGAHFWKDSLEVDPRQNLVAEAQVRKLSQNRKWITSYRPVLCCLFLTDP